MNSAKPSENSSGGLLWVGLFVIAYVTYFAKVSLWLLSRFGYSDWDLAIYNQIFKGALSGRPFISLMDLPWWGNHVEMTAALFLPVYAIFPSAAALLVIQALMLGLAAFPLFLIARKELGQTWGIVLATIYLLYPAVGFTNLNEFHPESFLPLIQFFLFYYFIKSDFKKFCLFLFLCLFSKENMSLMIVAMGLYALFKRRPAAWVVVPVVSGVLWFIFCIYAIMPPLTQGKIGFYEIYGHLGSTLPQIIGNIAAHPIETLRLLTMPGKITYMTLLLGPLSFLPLLSPSVLFIALPNFLQHLLSLRPQETSLIFYYAAESMAFLFIAAVGGLKFLFARMPYLKRSWAAYLFIISISLFFATREGMPFQVTSNLKDTPQRKETASALNRQAGLLPENASAIATFRYLPKLSDRTSRLYSFHRAVTGTYQLTNRPYVLPQNIEYALVDFNEAFFYSFSFGGGSEAARARTAGFFEKGNWGVVDAFNDSVVLKKDHPGGEKLCERIESLPGGVSGAVVFNNEMKLSVLPFSKPAFAAGERLPLVFFWQPLENITAYYACLFALFNEAGEMVYRVEGHPLTYGFYLPPFWKKGEIVKENFRLGLPSFLAKGRYSLCVGIYDFSKGRLTQAVSDHEEQKPPRNLVLLGDIRIL